MRMHRNIDDCASYLLLHVPLSLFRRNFSRCKK